MFAKEVRYIVCQALEALDFIPMSWRKCCTAGLSLVVCENPPDHLRAWL